MQFYFMKLKNFPVIFPTFKCLWTGVYGVQVRNVFIGVIIGGKDERD